MSSTTDVLKPNSGTPQRIISSELEAVERGPLQMALALEHQSSDRSAMTQKSGGRAACGAARYFTAPMRSWIFDRVRAEILGELVE